MTQAEFRFRRGNPDVLTSIANLSNDEVFTPPAFANQMLDRLQEAWATSNRGANIWEDSSVTFLDPFTKSGVFLREITQRLTQGLEKEIPDLQARVNHILTKQVFGIAITKLTSYLARRSVYCSKLANGEHSIATAFDDESGNIWFERTEHNWVGGRNKIITADDGGREVTITSDGRCRYCGANQKDYGRGLQAETYAYRFIHDDNPGKMCAEILGVEMKFDVVIGNPPYQLSDGGFGISALPIYHHFIRQAKALEPRFLSMVVPARWFAGGKGLDEFREEMLSDSRLRLLEDFPDSNDVFPGTQIKGGVCYFLWERDNPGPVRVRTYDKGEIVSEAVRPLRETEASVFIRYNLGVSVLKKVFAIESDTRTADVVFKFSQDSQFRNLVSPRKPFGFDTTFKGSAKSNSGDLLIHQNGGTGFVSRNSVVAGHGAIDEWKVFIPRAGSGSDSFPHSILSKPFIGEPGTVSSETYIYIGPFADKGETENVISYLKTKFLRFLVLLHKTSQSTTRLQYSFVPNQDFSRSWTDEALYAKYGLTEEEISFIDSMVRPMELENG